ncbi:protein-L-isoaspartate O-methyltransferase [Nanoarchaeota archaeon NZ13-N]|nr:MAG: protein-L-isoaspartate O-methyltransferase [Nanoarchaeota archaeon NZ13-N]
MKIENLLELLKSYNISENVIEAFKAIKREWFVPEEYKEYSYYDEVIPLFEDVTISQPSVVAFMLDLLEVGKGMKILEIGTGSGYSTALLSYLVGENGRIISMEINRRSYEYARSKLEELVTKNVIPDNFELILGNGYYGYERGCPYDRIICHAAIKNIPDYWLRQMEDGIIVAPVGGYYQRLEKIIVRRGKIIEKYPTIEVIFVPLKI